MAMQTYGVLDSFRDRLARHPLYGVLSTSDDVVLFLRHHVFCVWDFQSLLKAIQRHFTCTAIPWWPTGDNEARRLINEIVLEEESDDDGLGGYMSHFELYLGAMEEAGADTDQIDKFLAAVRGGENIADGLRGVNVPSATARFVRHTFEIIDGNAPHKLVAAFALGREDLIPMMFVELLSGLESSGANRFGRLLHYLRRHIILDGEKHSPRAHQLLERVCAGDSRLQREAIDVAKSCLTHRLAVWDEVHAAIVASRRGLGIIEAERTSDFVRRGESLLLLSRDS